MRGLTIIVLGLSFGLIGACSSSTDSGATSGTSKVGGACKSTTDCESGLECSTDDPGGQCVKSCKTQSDCPSGSTCTDENECYASCTKQSDCTRSGYECVDATTVDKKPTRTCDTAPAKGSAEIGDACASNADCKSGTCETGDPDGQCTAACKQQSDCPSGSTCTDESVCYKTCSSASDCTREGYGCVDAMTVDKKPVKTCDTP